MTCRLGRSALPYTTLIPPALCNIITLLTSAVDNRSFAFRLTLRFDLLLSKMPSQQEEGAAAPEATCEQTGRSNMDILYHQCSILADQANLTVTRPPRGKREALAEKTSTFNTMYNALFLLLAPKVPDSLFKLIKVRLSPWWAAAACSAGVLLHNRAGNNHSKFDKAPACRHDAELSLTAHNVCDAIFWQATTVSKLSES